MHDGRLREGKRFAHEAGEALTKGVVAPFHMIGLPAVLAHGRMLIRGQDRSVGFPKVMKTVGRTIGNRNSVPKALAGLATAVANRIRDDLPGATAERQPKPGLIDFADDKGPQFIEFPHIRRFGRKQSRCEGRLLIGFFLATRSRCCGIPQRYD